MKGNNKILRIALPAFFLSFLFTGCTDQVNTIEEYKQWYADHKEDYIKTKYIRGLKFTVQHRPVEIMMLNEVQPGQQYTEEEINQLKQSYGHSKYFLLQVGVDEREETVANTDLIASGVRNYNEYSQKLEQLAFKQKEHIKLVMGQDTLSPSLYHYERSYELGKTQSILISFSVKKDRGEAVFIYDDKIFNTGRHKYRFDLDQKTPELPIAELISKP